MKEIELKLKVKNFTFDDLRKKFVGHVSKSVKFQEDNIFLFRNQVGKPIVAGSKIYRIRTVKENDNVKYLFTLKVQTDRKLVSDEYEFEISDPKIAREAMLASGLVERVRVAKTRVEGKIDEFNICIDEVEQLGVFIELEAFSNDGIDKIQAKMHKKLNSFDIEGEICRVPYDSQVEQLHRK